MQAGASLNVGDAATFRLYKTLSLQFRTSYIDISTCLLDANDVCQRRSKYIYSRIHYRSGRSGVTFEGRNNLLKLIYD